MNTENYACFSEGKRYLVSDYQFIIDGIEDSLLISHIPGGKFKFNVTGFIIVNNNVIVIFPKNYNLPSDFGDLKKESRILLNVLLRYRNEQDISEEENQLLSGSKVNANGRICAGVKLLEDFRENGFIKRDNLIDKSYSNGFINWQKTINKTIPIMNHGRPIYARPIMRNHYEDRYNIIRLLHEYAISECSELWGWLLGYDEIEFDRELPCGLREAASILNEELARVYNEREKYVIQNMIAFYESLSGVQEEKKQELLVTPYFYWVWEAICGYVFDNDYEKLKKMVPKPTWESNVINANIAQRPDILTIDNEILYIWDAKYYDYNEGHIPGWHDVVKQLFYKYTVEQKAFADKVVIKEIKNIFLLPDNNEENYRYLGYVHVNEVQQLGRIAAYALNIKKMLDSYAGHKSSSIPQEVKNNLVDK